MENVEMIATRESFGKELVNIKNEKIVVLDADVDTSTKTNIFKEIYPNRFFEIGIAEADMIGTAAGFATCGKIPVASTFAAFITGRCYDQIRNSVAYPNLNVKLIGTHSGITVGEDGATHQMLEDISLMRSLPNMTVISPADDISTKALLKEIIKHEGPVYMRLSRVKTPVLYTEDTKFKIGKGIQIGDGLDGTLFATGDLLWEAIEIQEKLVEKGINIRVVDIHTIKPIDKELIIKSARETGLLFSLEDHNIIGGLGSSIAEVLIKEYPKKLTMFGIDDCFGKSGSVEDLLKFYKLDKNSIYNKMLKEFKI